MDASSATTTTSALSQNVWEDLAASTAWMQFQASAKSFVSEASTDAKSLSACFGKSFDSLFARVSRAVQKELGEHDKKDKPEHAHRANLQGFCDGRHDPSIRLSTYTSFRDNLAKDETTRMGEQLARRIQWQIHLRLALWERMGNKAFVAAWSQQIVREMAPKRRRRVKKETKGAVDASWKLCCDDITSLVSLGLMKWAQISESLRTEDFLRSCGLTYTLDNDSSWKSRLVRTVWAFFDLLEDSKPLKKQSCSKEQPSAVLPPIPLPEDESVKSKLTASTSSSTNKENAQTYFGKRVKLTAPVIKKTNSLLGKSARSRFVGSHFNTNLSNMSALFRTVSTQAPPKRKPATTSSESTTRKRPVPRVKAAGSASCKIPVVVQVNETPAPQRKRSRVVWESPGDLRVPRVLPL